MFLGYFISYGVFGIPCCTLHPHDYWVKTNLYFLIFHLFTILPHPLPIWQPSKHSLYLWFVSVLLAFLFWVLCSIFHKYEFITILLFTFLFLFFFFLKKDYLFKREEGREKERERYINAWLPLERPSLETWLATQACALTGNQTSDP